MVPKTYIIYFMVLKLNIGKYEYWNIEKELLFAIKKITIVIIDRRSGPFFLCEKYGNF